MKPEGEFHRVESRTYVRIWVALVALTIITVSLAGMELGPLGIPIALVIAGSKSGLVLYYFMHLKYERLIFFRIVISGTLITLVLLMIIVFTDVAFR